MTEHELYFVQLGQERVALRRAKRQLWTAALAVWLLLVGIAALLMAIMEALH